MALHEDCLKREKELNAELQQLKAEVFSYRTRDRVAILSSQPTVPIDIPDEIPVTTSTSVATRTPPNIAEAPEDWAKLLAEQEQLLKGYQLENERLVAAAKVKAAEDKALRAAFFDERESMNKELNRLRNMLVKENHIETAGEGVRRSGNTGTHQESLEDLKVQDVNRTVDGNERSSMTKAARVSLLDKEEEIRKLRFENDKMFNELIRLRNILRPITLASTVSVANIGMTVTADEMYGPGSVETARREAEQAKEELQQERARHEEEKTSLLERIKFFVDTQPLLSVVEEVSKP